MSEVSQTNSFSFDFPYPDHEFPIYEAERLSAIIPDRPLVTDWCEKNIHLSKGYTNKGQIIFKKWQIEPINAFLNWPAIGFLGVVQTGKSLMAEMCAYYAMAVMQVEGLFAYDTKDKCREVFKTRIKNMILDNKVLRDLWSGKDDDLSIENIQLLHCFWRIASAQNRDDLASFPAGVVIWSEGAKLKGTNINFDVRKELEGRQESYSGARKRLIIETSPNEYGDPVYNEIFKPGGVILEFHVPCPLCSCYQVLDCEQIKLRRTSGNEPTRDSSRIRYEKEAAVYYECISCKGEIKDSDRVKMEERGVWAKREISERVRDNYTFFQAAERIDNDGTIHYSRENMVMPWYNWGRLIDSSHPFWEHLARFFESQRSSEAFHIFLNNDRGRFFYRRSERIASAFLQQKVLNSTYNAFGEGSFLPSGILVLVCSIDTQDNGFYWVVEGFGQTMESWVVRFGFVPYSIDEVESENYEVIFLRLSGAINEHPYSFLTNEKRIININFARGFQDRGGHRAKLVDYICERLLCFDPYIGATRDDPRRELIYDTGNGFYYGKTELISDLVGARMKKELFHLPADTTEEFLAQIQRQYHYKEVDSKGNEKRKWKHGGDDHYRDCLNLNMACIIDLGLDTALHNPLICDNLRNSIFRPGAEDMHNQKEENKQRPANRSNVRSSYFGGRRW